MIFPGHIGTYLLVYGYHFIYFPFYAWPSLPIVGATIVCPSVAIGTYNLSKGTHPLGRVMGLPGYIPGYPEQKSVSLRILFPNFSFTTRLTLV